MSWRFPAAILVTVLAVGAIIFSALSETSRHVVTVHELLEAGGNRERIQLGARVAEGEPEYKTSPELLLRFDVHDIPSGGQSIPVVYRNIKPDGFKPGRDVILEGRFADGVFVAERLLTQCPSKYTPPGEDGANAVSNNG
jgi:cytochrome c-type biogenesis protein CcmE